MLEKDKPIFSPVGDLVLCFGGTRVLSRFKCFYACFNFLKNIFRLF
jgi:hypothetical protein